MSSIVSTVTSWPALVLAMTVTLGAPELSAGVPGVRGTFSPDGQRIAFQRLCGGDAWIGILNLADGRVEWVERSAGQAAFPFWAKDGRIAYSFGEVDLAARKNGSCQSKGFGIRIREAGQVKEFSRGLWFEESPSIPDDGQSVWYASTKGIKHFDTCKRYPGEGFRAKIMRRNLADGTETAVYAVSNSLMCGVRSPQVSPDGTQLAWSELHAFREDEMVVRVGATNNLRQSKIISTKDMTAYGPKWNSDGRFLCFTGFRAGDPGWGVFVARLEDGSVRRICSGENPAFSPDGRKIVYDDGKELHLWDLTARCEVPLMNREAPDFRVLALVDSGDFYRQCNLATVEGNLQVLDHVMLTHPTDILWRDKGGGVLRYDSAEDPVELIFSFFDSRRLLNQTPSAFWSYSTGGSEVLLAIERSCAERGVGFGIHTTYEENHRWPCSESPWNLRHPQFACRTRGGKPRTDTCSLSYPEVLEHKLRIIDERLAFKPQMIFLDCCVARMGSWTPACEYVPPMIEKWTKRYGCEPPADWKDPRWMAMVAENVMDYLKLFSAKCRAKGVKFVMGFSPFDLEDKYLYDQWSFDWKKLVNERVIDGLVVMGVKVDPADAMGSTRKTLEYVKGVCGPVELYFHCSAYDANYGIASYAKALKVSHAEAAQQLIDVSRAVGVRGVILECVDYNNYSPAVREVLGRINND